ncbi:MAG: hypothetical protein ACOYEV_08690 [Candidatus Nanopelagicales bacterium]
MKGNRPDSPSPVSGGSAGSRNTRHKSEVESEESSTTGWKIASAFLAALLLGTAGWAGFQTTRVRQAQDGSAAGNPNLDAVTAQLAALDTTTTQLTSDVATIKAQLGLTTGGVNPGSPVTPGATVIPSPGVTGTGAEAFKKVTDTLPVTSEQYTAALAQTKSLNSTYQAAAAAAKAAPSDKALQIASLSAQSALLRNCATVFAGATQTLYAAPAPQTVMEQIATELASIVGECKVINQQ